MSAGLQITIDTQDAEGCPESPLTLTVQVIDSTGIPSREPAEWGETALIGASIPTMLRELADLFEAGRVNWEDEPLTIERESA